MNTSVICNNLAFTSVGVGSNTAQDSMWNSLKDCAGEKLSC